VAGCGEPHTREVSLPSSVDPDPLRPSCGHAVDRHGAPGVIERAADPPELPRLLARAQSVGLTLDLVDVAADGLGRHRCRTYQVYLQPALWGGLDVVRSWGRRGHLRRPRRLATHHPDEAAAEAALAAVIRRRLQHAYHEGKLA